MEVAGALAAHQVTAVAFKGIHLAFAVAESPWARPLVDADLLFLGCSPRTAITILRAAKLGRIVRGSSPGTFVVAQESSRAYVDMHSSPLLPFLGKWSARRLLDNARSVPAALGPDILVPDHADAALLALAHHVKDGYGELGSRQLAFDLALLASTDEAAPENAARRARAWGLRRTSLCALVELSERGIVTCQSAGSADRWLDAFQPTQRELRESRSLIARDKPLMKRTTLARVFCAASTSDGLGAVHGVMSVAAFGTTRLVRYAQSVEDIATDQAPVLRIRSTAGWRALDLREFLHFRELLWFLMLRDIKLRYKQTALGLAWAAIQPLSTVIVFSLLFGRLAHLPSDGVPYSLSTLIALLPWQLFAYAMSQSSNSLVAEQRLISKVYFPRLIVPIASVLAGVIDFLVAVVLALGTLVMFHVAGWFRFVPQLRLLALVPFAVLALASALAVGIWLSALNVKYRDVRYVLPFMTQLWFFATPVAYASSLVPAAYRGYYGLNPMAGVVEGFRWSVFGARSPNWTMIAVSVGTVTALLTSGLFYFRRVERSFADIV
jgi:lipopolysaccharide transport system permease protein